MCICQDAYNNLIQVMCLTDESHFSEDTKESFNMLLQKGRNVYVIGKKNHFYSVIRYLSYQRAEVLSPAERLALTIRFLASGDSQVHMASGDLLSLLYFP